MMAGSGRNDYTGDKNSTQREGEEEERKRGKRERREEKGRESKGGGGWREGETETHTDKHTREESSRKMANLAQTWYTTNKRKTSSVHLSFFPNHFPLPS